MQVRRKVKNKARDQERKMDSTEKRNIFLAGPRRRHETVSSAEFSLTFVNSFPNPAYETGSFVIQTKLTDPGLM
jgi:hypothetical protein